MTKWPRLVVVPEAGRERVSREQANEILLRTDFPHLWCNDRDWVVACAAVLGIEAAPAQLRSGQAFAAVDAWRASIGALRLHYLHNRRIMSTWIGGPHGWLDWDGRVGCGTWNIGTWPSRQEVTGDWEAIAAAFPYLDLHAQCVTDSGEGNVAAQWRVTGGRAYLVEPVGVLPVAELTTAQLLGQLRGGHGERGASLERLAQAHAQLTRAPGAVRPAAEGPGE